MLCGPQNSREGEETAKNGVKNGTDGREGWGRLRAGRASEERCIPTLPLSNAPETLEAHATESQAL
jgi:hypothetical protein